MEGNADTIHDVIKEPAQANGGFPWEKQTVAVLRALVNPFGPGPAICEDLVGASATVPLNAGQISAAVPAQIANPLSPPDHAEVTVLASAEQRGWKPLVIGISRWICIPGVNARASTCLNRIFSGGGTVLGDSQSASWPDNILLLNLLNSSP